MEVVANKYKVIAHNGGGGDLTVHKVDCLGRRNCSCA